MSEVPSPASPPKIDLALGCTWAMCFEPKMLPGNRFPSCTTCWCASSTNHVAWWQPSRDTWSLRRLTSVCLYVYHSWIMFASSLLVLYTSCVWSCVCSLVPWCDDDARLTGPKAWGRRGCTNAIFGNDQAWRGLVQSDTCVILYTCKIVSVKFRICIFVFYIQFYIAWRHWHFERDDTGQKYFHWKKHASP